MKFDSRLIGLLAIALGLVGLGWFIYGGFNTIADRGRMVTVKGLSERQVNADRVTWPIASVHAGNDLTSLYDQAKSNTATIRHFLNSNGVTDQEISMMPPKVDDAQANTYSSGKPANRYILTSILTVTSSNVSTVDSLIREQGQLLAKGIALSTDWQYQPSYEYTLLTRIKPQMVADATANARQAAEQFAKDSDSKLGKIMTATQGQFSIEDRDEYTPTIKTIRVVTNITYQLRD